MKTDMYLGWLNFFSQRVNILYMFKLGVGEQLAWRLMLIIQTICNRYFTEFPFGKNILLPTKYPILILPNHLKIMKHMEQNSFLNAIIWKSFLDAFSQSTSSTYCYILYKWVNWVTRTDPGHSYLSIVCIFKV